MNHTLRVARRMTAAGSLVAVTVLFSGCLIGPRDEISDEFARIATQEVSNMSANSSTMIRDGGAAKNAPLYGDTIYYDWNIIPYTYDPGCGGYIRTAAFTCSDGYERIRVDTVIFRDESGAALQYPTLLTVGTVSHVRSVKRTKGGNELDVRIVMNSTITRSPEISHIKNGSISGTYNGESIATGSVTAVTRAFENGRWQFPRSGQIQVAFPRRSYEANFLGDGDAELVITNTVTDKTKVIRIHVEQR
ncbi:MAG: hypothetical protein JW768_12025 [Chitinispirillaceae bacterium]|nr:hypothetical protein [Chitinispirillaceae bacterium]